MKKLTLLIVSFLLATFLSGCPEATHITTTTTVSSPTTTITIGADQIAPSDLEYVGAFRLPAGTADNISWDWGGSGATYYPGRNSIYAIGHDQTMYISEFSIPSPVNSRNLADLNTASTLQPFTNVRTGVGQLTTLFDNSDIRRAGIAYLPALGSQTSAKLYLCWGDHFQEGDSNLPSHMWCDLDFSNAAGAWKIEGDPMLYRTNDYMFEIPASWANANASTSGMYLATGRYRDGGWSGQGPNLFAIAPWADGNPPANGAELNSVVLLGYSSTSPDGYDFGGGHTMNNYHNSDEWSGGAFLSAGSKSAVIFVGNKGLGTDWYGFSDGTQYPIDDPPEFPYPAVPAYPHDARGWWSTSFEAQVIFYNPADLAAVANGTMQPYEPQPYATLSLDEYLYNIDKVNHASFPDNRNQYRLGGCAFDRANGLLYIIEYRGEPAGGEWNDDRAVVHVFQVN